MSEQKIIGKPAALTGLMDIAPYVPGKAGRGRNVWKLSANESALGASPRAKEALRAAAENLHIYPDGAARDLKAAIAEVEGLDPTRLIIGSGSDEILQLLIRAYAEPGDNILQSAHGFSYYAIAAATSRVETIFAAEKDLHADVDEIVAAATPRTRLVFIANPNSPTGTVLGKEEIHRLRAKLPAQVMLVLDGAYAEYMTEDWYTNGRDLVDRANENGLDNVVMTRTFSKIYGLGGLRVGWGYAAPEVISLLERLRPPFNITTASLKAAEAAIQDQGFVVKNRNYTRDLRGMVRDQLTSFGMEPEPSHANFVTIDLQSPDRAAAYMRHLEADDILVRSAASSRLPAHVRVTIGPEEAMTAYLQSTERFLSG